MAELDYMDFPSMEKMAQTFGQAQQQLQETQQAMTKIAEQMEGGALLGQGGSTFVTAIKNTLNKKLKTMADKMKELQTDINSAQQAMRQAEGTAKGRF